MAFPVVAITNRQSTASTPWLWCWQTGALVLTAGITTRLALARRQQPQPQAILILDGSDARVRFGAVFAGLHPDLPVWISGDCSGRPAGAPGFLRQRD